MRIANYCPGNMKSRGSVLVLARAGMLGLLLVAACGGGGGGDSSVSTVPGMALPGSGDQFASSILATADGGYIIAGTSMSGGLGGTDAFLLKTDGAGGVAWQKFYGSSGNERGNVVQITQDGGYIVAGDADSPIAGGPGGIYLVKTDSSGNLQWDKTFAGVVAAKHLSYSSVRQTGDGGYVVAGTGPGTEINPEPDVYLIRTDGDGNVLWQQTFGAESGNIWAEGYDVRQTSDGGFVVTGFHESTLAFAVKLDADGNLQWNQGFTTTVGPIFAVEQTSDGGYVYIGRVDGMGGCSALVVKADSAGQLQWTKLAGNLASCSDRVFGVGTADGGFILATGGAANNGDAYVVKVDAQGNEQWARLYGGNGEDIATGLVQRGDGGYAVIGYTRSFGDRYQVYFLQLDPSGNAE